MPANPTLAEMFQDTQTDKPLRNERIYTAVREHDYTLFQLQKHLGLSNSHYGGRSNDFSRFSCVTSD